MARRFGIARGLTEISVVIMMLLTADGLAQGSRSPTFSVTWTQNLSGAATEPLVIGDYIFLNSEPNHAFRVRTGEKIELSDSAVVAELRQRVGLRYVVFRQWRQFIVRDLFTGKVVRQMAHLMKVYRSPIAGNSTLILHNPRPELIRAIDFVSGHVLWERRSARHYNGEHLFVGSKVLFFDQEKVYCVDSRSGNNLWEASIGDLASPILQHRSSVYLGIRAKGIFKLDVDTGDPKLLFEDVNSRFRQVEIRGEKLYFVAENLHVLDLRTGDHTIFKSDPMISDVFTIVGRYFVGFENDYEYSGPVLVIDTTTGEVVDEFEEWRTEDGWKKFFFRKTGERFFVGVCDEELCGLQL